MTVRLVVGVAVGLELLLALPPAVPLLDEPGLLVTVLVEEAQGSTPGGSDRRRELGMPVLLASVLLLVLPTEVRALPKVDSLLTAVAPSEERLATAEVDLLDILTAEGVLVGVPRVEVEGSFAAILLELLDRAAGAPVERVLALGVPALLVGGTVSGILSLPDLPTALVL